MVKDHSDSEKGNLLLPHRLLFPISSKVLYALSHRQDSTYHGLCYTSCGSLAGMRNSSSLHCITVTNVTQSYTIMFSIHMGSEIEFGIIHSVTKTRTGQKRSLFLGMLILLTIHCRIPCYKHANITLFRSN